MTPRSLFNIILKIMGLFVLKDMIVSIPEMLGTAAFLFSYSMEGVGASAIFFGVLTIAFYILIAVHLIFRTDWVIDKFKLEKGFNQDTLQINLHRSAVIAIAILVIGGMMVVSGTPLLIGEIISYVKERSMNRGILYKNDPNYTYMIVFTSQIIIGLLLIGYQRQLVLLIEQRKREAIVKE